jgi:hypothetical protein
MGLLNFLLERFDAEPDDDPPEAGDAAFIDERRWSIAVHEAGHVVAYLALGWEFTHAWIAVDPDGRTRGETVAAAELADSDVHGHLVLLMAGAAAEDLFFDGEVSEADLDYVEAQDLLPSALVSLAEAEEEAGDLVDEHRDLVEAVAWQLFDRGRVTAAQVAAL